MSDATGMTVNTYLQWQRQISHAESENGCGMNKSANDG